jgi:hypothetical protein
MVYALGRGLTYEDMPVVRSIVRDAQTQDFRFSAVISGIVNSQPFQMRLKPAQQQALVDHSLGVRP